MKRHTAQDSSLNTHHRENLKPNILALRHVGDPDTTCSLVAPSKGPDPGIYGKTFTF
jgi:hypothetical protein